MYRIVGFEVDPRSVSEDSLQIMSEGNCAIREDATVYTLANRKSAHMYVV